MTLLWILNGLIVLCMTGIMIRCYRKDGAWNRQAGRSSLRFFTTLSNLLCAVASLLLLAALPGGGPPRWVWLLRYIGTAAVTVTFLTVMVFLGPTLGYKGQLGSREAVYLHVIEPLASVFSFCFLERFYPLPFGTALLGLLPVLLYGTLYLYEVVRVQRWEDFYSFNRDGKWPISFGGMVLGAFLICLLLRLLYTL